MATSTVRNFLQLGTQEALIIGLLIIAIQNISIHLILKYT